MPIKTNISIEKKEAQDLKPLPETIYQVELLDITDEQKPTYDTRNKPEEEKVYETVLKFQFTLLSGKDGDENLRGRNVWESFVPTFLYISKKNGKNKLYQITEALLGHELSPEEEARMDTEYMNGLIGKQCRVGIKNKQSGDNVYSNIESYYRAEQDMTPLTAEEKENATVKPKEDEEQKQKVERAYEEYDQDIPPFDGSEAQN